MAQRIACCVGDIAKISITVIVQCIIWYYGLHYKGSLSQGEKKKKAFILCFPSGESVWWEQLLKLLIHQMTGHMTSWRPAIIHRQCALAFFLHALGYAHLTSVLQLYYTDCFLFWGLTSNYWRRTEISATYVGEGERLKSYASSTGVICFVQASRALVNSRPLTLHTVFCCLPN